MKEEQLLRIGITMRVSHPQGYVEPRDTIARDWSAFLMKELPIARWLYLPNVEKNITDYVERWQLNAFILSGGEDVGTDESRDITEREVTKYAIENKYPLLGVCRGMQLMYQEFGGTIKRGSVDFCKMHVATHHDIKFCDKKINVNSFHQNQLCGDTVPSNITVEARCESDNSIEAFSADNMLGLMWHPERRSLSAEWNADLIQRFFNYNTKS